ncbi:Ribokinase-like protein [Rhodocollybia butyracea]|uniref:Ribokinase-like protein n=1 Tax=Rhodocollybia butyracea TaxID=206335 RepID=A0A9P5PFF4_9AGAR|nr:Ribokinase-like protein [Rhodocollybia butyracea]
MDKLLANQPAVLTIAGSDSSGGAGIQADLKTFAAHGCYGTSAITALTAQNTKGVQHVFPSSPEFLTQQLSSILDDIDVKAMKTGMLFDEKVAQAAIHTLKTHYASASSLPPLVCDPVCVSTSGHTLLDPNAIDTIIRELFPLATLITPNKAEAELLLSREARKSSRQIETVEDMLLAAEDLLSFGSKAVLLKGGHLTASVDDVRRVARAHPEIEVVRDGLLMSDEENMEILRVNCGAGGDSSALSSCELVVDVLHESSGSTSARRTMILCRSRIESTSTHGTGCTLSAAIAARLASGSDLANAVRFATRYTHLGIETADSTIGHGHGPLNHFHSMQQLFVPRITPTNPYPLSSLFIRKTSRVWKAYVEHDFVKLLGKGTLPKENFVHFIRQDYLYLRYYARAYALLAAKSSSFSAIGLATQTILNVLNEINTHTAFCATFGVSEETLLTQTPESPATAAYGAYLIDVGLRGDTTMLLVALLSCLLGYGEVGLWLKKNARPTIATPGSDDRWVILEGNPYLQWIEDYSGERYQGAVRMGLATIEARAAADPPSKHRLEEWCAVWERCTELEKGFWDMAMNLS